MSARETSWQRVQRLERDRLTECHGPTSLRVPPPTAEETARRQRLEQAVLRLEAHAARRAHGRPHLTLIEGGVEG